MVVRNVDEKIIIEAYNAGISSVIKLVNDLSYQIETLNSEISSIKAENKTLIARMTDLEARLNMNSKNSSKPPSSDGYKKSNKNNSRKKSGRTTGGQLGHEGKTLAKVEKPDTIVDIKTPDQCNCGCDLKNVRDIRKTRQVFDLPKIKINVTEYVTYEKVCPSCGKIHTTEFPAEVAQPTQYGANLKALMGYLVTYQFIPLNRTVELIRDITDQTISEGTLVNVSQLLYRQLEQPLNKIKAMLINSDVVHFDETGVRDRGKLNWMHVASTPTLTCYEVHKNRGSKASGDIGILPNFKGTAVHDHWKPYYKYTDCSHAECNAHNVRYLRDILENYKQEWAGDMISLLIEINRRIETLKKEHYEGMAFEETITWLGRYHELIEKGIQEDHQKSPKVFNEKGKEKKSKSLQLLFKLQKYDIETLAFMYDFDVPFDNNLAERDLRMPKLRQKISGCFRGEIGANVFCRIRSYLSTSKKNGLTAMEAITLALKGQAFIPEG